MIDRTEWLFKKAFDNGDAVQMDIEEYWGKKYSGKNTYEQGFQGWVCHKNMVDNYPALVDGVKRIRIVGSDHKPEASDTEGSPFYEASQCDDGTWTGDTDTDWNARTCAYADWLEDFGSYVVYIWIEIEHE